MYSLTRVPHRGFSLLGGVVAPARTDAAPADGFAPALDIVETADGYEVKVDLPGVKKEGLSVNIKENVLTIEAESRSESAHKEGGTVISERRSGRQYRALRLGRAVDESKVSAEYNDGVLKLTLPRPAEAAGRKIDIDVRH